MQENAGRSERLPFSKENGGRYIQYGRRPFLLEPAFLQALLGRKNLREPAVGGRGIPPHSK